MNISGEILRTALRRADITQEKAANALGMSRQTLSNWLKSAELNDTIIKNVMTILNIDLGSVEKNAQTMGNSLHNDKTNNSASLSDYKKVNTNNGWEKNSTHEAKPIYQDVVQVPIVEKRARAGYVHGYADPEYMETLRKVFVAKQYEKGNYLVFEIDGNSMDDDSKKSICNGDAVLCKELDKFYWKKTLFQRVFIIITEEEVLCKQITAHNINTGVITCHSFNPAYEDFELNLSEVNQLFYLVRIVERDIQF